MKRMKIIVVIMMLFFISGCSVDYDLIITSNHRIKEDIKFYMKNEQYIDEETSIKEIFKGQIDSYKRMPAYRDYQYNYKIGQDVSYIHLSTWYPTFSSFQNSVIYKNLFENILVLENDEFISFKTVGKYYYEYLYGEDASPDPNFYMGDIKVKIRLHNKVLESNADVVDGAKNTLEWNISRENNEKSIYFKLDHRKRYDIILIDMFLFNKSTFIIIGVTLLLIAIIGIYFYARYRNNDSI